MVIARTAAADTGDRILEATFDAVADFGLSRLTMEDVAGRAGCSRQTLYRYFPSRDHLLTTLLLREEERILDGVRAAFAEAGSLEEAVEEAVALVLTSARRHPLLDRLLRTEPEQILPYLTTRSAPVLDRAREAVSSLLRAHAPRAPAATRTRVADAAVRLLLSHVLTPSGQSPRTAARGLAGLMTAALTIPERRTR